MLLGGLDFPKHLKTISYAEFWGQTECSMGGSKIVSYLFDVFVTGAVVQAPPEKGSDSRSPNQSHNTIRHHPDSVSRATLI